MTNYTTWMSTPQVQGLTMSQLKLPGTHDSATYSLTNTLSQIEYSNIAFLWSLNSGVAPVNGQYPWSGGQYYVGQPMYDFIMSIVKAVSTSQDQTILDQLNGGIRYFDLRIYYDTNLQDIYLQHALRGCSLETVFQQVQSFLTDNPTSEELIILDLSHTNFASVVTPPGAPTPAQMVINFVKTYVGPHVYMPAGAAGTSYDFQNLSGVSVGSITDGQNAVMLLNTDGGYLYESQVINTSGFASSGRSADGVDTVAALQEAEGGPLQNNPKGTLYQISWVLTPQNTDVYTQAANSLLNNGATPILQYLAVEANNALSEFIQQNSGCNFNLITVDWYEYGAPQTVVEICVGLNAAN